MDALAALLDGPRARSAFLLRSVMTAPWGLRIEDRAPLTIAMVVRGGAWLRPDDGDAVALRPGDLTLLRGPDAYVVADSATTPPQALIGEGQTCTTLWGEDLSEAFSLGVRTWGNDPDGETVLLTGTYTGAGEVGGRLLAALPPVLLLRREEWSSALVPLLLDEVDQDRAGQEVVLDRMLDLLVVSVLRSWLSSAGRQAPGWWSAQGDPVVGPALRLMQERPGEPWTVAGLARATCVSRATLARRFCELVGEPPMGFLTDWRLSVAADLLAGTDATLASIAQQVGYSSPFALSAAFSRVRGVSPRAHRAAARRTA